MFPKSVDLLARRQVLIIGFARQGQALARWLPTLGAHVTVNDRRPMDDLDVDPMDFPNVKFVLGDHPDHLLDDVDVICVSGGVPLTLPIIKEALRREIIVTNDAHLFVDRCLAPVIGITGSAGKTTTTTLVGEILKKAGHTTWVGGNIGSPLLDVMSGIRPQHKVVMELSSFQLELMRVSPPIAAVLNITPNHLDRHGTMENYMRAKAKILIRQSGKDKIILGRDNVGNHVLEPIVRGDLLWFSKREIVADGACMVGERLVVIGRASPDGSPRIVCKTRDILLRGEHNILNVLAACAITGAAGISPEAMSEAISEFRGVPHRLEIVRRVSGVTYVNDSIATAPERVVAALHSYDEPLVLLVGGADKKLPWQEMISLALSKSRHIVAFGRDGDIVVNEIKKLTGKTDIVTRVETLEQAVRLAVKIARTGDIVLLSPGGTSYDAYMDFAARGEHFRRLVMAL
jgi:UDP-N-acetylmuramoylalanine--D-glutamate ligase